MHDCFFFFQFEIKFTISSKKFIRLETEKDEVSTDIDVELYRIRESSTPTIEKKY